MDCDKFDQVLMDLLYDELDELTRAAAGRHVEQCERCRKSLQAFRATREIGALPLAELSDGFESRVLEAERRVRLELPLRARLERAFAVLSSYAMRPQLAMAALLLLMIGISLVWLRPQPGSHGAVMVTERGIPEVDRELVVAVREPVEARAKEEPQAARPASPELKQSAGASAPALNAEQHAVPEEVDDRARAEAEDRAYAVAMDAYRAGQHQDAQRKFDAIVASEGRNSAAAELYAALATEKADGCSAAVPRFDSVSAHNASNDLGHQATWHSANCRVQLGQEARARLDLERLMQLAAYENRARDALNRLNRDAMLASRDERTRSDKAKRAAPPAAPGSPKAGTAAPEAESAAGVGAKVVAGPPLAARAANVDQKASGKGEKQSEKSRPAAAAPAKPATAKPEPTAGKKSAPPAEDRK